MMPPTPSSVAQSPFVKGIDLLTTTIQGLQRYLSTGMINSEELVTEYLRRIEADNHQGCELGAVLEVAPWQKLRDEARRLDELRKTGVVLSELHGVPLLIKDSIATDHDLGMETTAGSFALKGSVVPGEATVVANLRRKGAIILGKANLTEFSGITGVSGPEWSGRGGICSSAYVPGGDPSGSSGGSAVGTSAGTTEQPSTDYTQYTQMPFATFQGKKLGVPRRTVFDDTENWKGCFTKDDLNQIEQIFNQAIAKMQVLGAVIEDPADMISLGKISISSFLKDIITNEFRGCFEAYLRTLQHSKVNSLKELIA
ncbi:hypothetical protein QFC19_008670 [Naganishia cerealis]|uniref:Uncharacterized protein n=1 Tax=Naganishia cerealis TaxID=610337 RepID=A0ACC2V065_9TREE|nr:hypothetical protein QFC19_008670 [Naganishia cerealis]